MRDARWQLWKRAYDSRETCGEPFGTGRWRVTCNLPPDHPLPHEARRGYGTVVHATWPWQPSKPAPTSQARASQAPASPAKANPAKADPGPVKPTSRKPGPGKAPPHPATGSASADPA